MKHDPVNTHRSLLDEGTEDHTAASLTDYEMQKAEWRGPLRAAVIYEIVRRAGDHELERPTKSLIFSSIAAGIVITLSVLTEAYLRQALPETEWAHLIEAMGYTTGFIFVILARQQLFTESTISAVLPVLAKPTWNNLYAVARLWTIVFLGNLIGTAFFALWFTLYPPAGPETLDAIREISMRAMEPGFVETVMRGVCAGFLIAGVAWLLPSSRGFELHVIFLITYIIALGEFSHVIAGSAEAWYLAFGGHSGVFEVIFGFIVPALIGNVIGGTVLFAFLAFGQVVAELDETPAERTNGSPPIDTNGNQACPDETQKAAASAGYETRT
ncbi:formate/nitrite transporter family protein [Notoacmeibacter sp. MSK16QG-6]|uniref:formate/nitrite transporter family protein n=1 Tax=Notoacmeibacter sp. MSK16QG-6 TaxID=2957982 RepID=UPI00209E2946|nr:formate/nitrite transporter family protein [Notoacmeibacter sp. MSK16QG-6]MCP1198679.1 formate/nitrite transporter family protein [Notoacmeibacter sp. MSK16QG-6]